MKALLRFITTCFTLVILAAAIWLGTVLWFVNQIPSVPNTDKQETDAIVVLTGGTGRVEYGIKLLKEGRSKKLFISGVSSGVRLQDLIPNYEYNQLPGSVVLGYEAADTKGNARETADWVKKEKIKTLRMVTANYHIPRGQLELSRMLPGVTIIPDPVFPGNFKREGWWRYPGTTRLIVSEYHKYIASSIQHMLGMNGDGKKS